MKIIWITEMLYFILVKVEMILKVYVDKPMTKCMMSRGNLALKNNYNQDVFARLIRGHISEDGKPGRFYTFDGLYKVIKYWAEKGTTKFTVKYCKGHVPNRIAELHRFVCQVEDKKNRTSIGERCKHREVFLDLMPMTYRIAILITATNLIDPPLAPKERTCNNTRICGCAKLNGVDFPYVSRDGGRLFVPKSIVYECGCGDGCAKKSSERGIKYRLEVFHTTSKGWGVRSWDFIPSGGLVVEILRRGKVKHEHDKRTGPIKVDSNLYS
ncbi:hypothetical protein C5167_047893 [Papaver somniferum]|uniref:YDG domain-containing protein n=1 Tax=Papaver somniferum TaxID=3469 RepID=A0A4Y7LLY4_PAPSO|nr:hypothetical protein C5167_047893 [Papaver somniferum]